MGALILGLIPEPYLFAKTKITLSWGLPRREFATQSTGVPPQSGGIETTSLPLKPLKCVKSGLERVCDLSCV